MSDKMENMVPEGQQPIHTARFRLTPAAYTQLNLIVQRRGLKNAGCSHWHWLWVSR